MNRMPREPLSAEERALAAQLPRAPGRGEPGAELDARILAAAQVAVQAPANKRRRSWIAPISVAASLVLAVGLAWQLRPPSFPQISAPAAETASPPEAGVAATASQPAAEAPPVAVMKPIPAPPPRIVAPAPPVDVVAAPMAAPAEPLPAPPPSPPQPARAMADIPAAVAATQMAEPAAAAANATAKAGVMAATREHAAARTQQLDAAAMAAQAGEADDPGEEVPPATAAAPEVRDAWLRRIGELLKQGKQDEAKASLAEFRRRYPDAELPQELRKLEH